MPCHPPSIAIQGLGYSFGKESSMRLLRLYLVDSECDCNSRIYGLPVEEHSCVNRLSLISKKKNAPPSPLAVCDWRVGRYLKQLDQYDAFPQPLSPSTRATPIEFASFLFLFLLRMISSSKGCSPKRLPCSRVSFLHQGLHADIEFAP